MLKWKHQYKFIVRNPVRIENTSWWPSLSSDPPRLSKLSKHTRLCPTYVAVCIGFFPVSKKMGFSLDIFCCSYQHTFCLHVLTPKRIPDDFRMTYASLPLNTLYIHTNKVHLHPSRIQTHLRAWDIFFFLSFYSLELVWSWQKLVENSSILYTGQQRSQKNCG